MNTNLPSAKYWAWNPGLESQLPREYLPLSTVFRAENVIEISGSLRPNIDFPEPLDVDHAFNVENSHFSIIRAQRAADLYANMDLSPQSNVDFLKRCARWIPVINFADYETGQVYARLQRGKWVWRDEPHFSEALDNPEANAGLIAVAHNVYGSAFGGEQKHTDVATEKMHTLGIWGGAAPAA